MLARRVFPNRAVETHQSKWDWLAARRNNPLRIGASEVGAILGVSPWANAWDIWLDHQSSAVVEEQATLQTRWGLFAEDFIRAELAREAKAHVWGFDDWPVVIHPNGWASCSPDGCAWFRDQWVGVEVKFYQDLRLWGDTLDEIPAHILHQVQWQLLVTGQPIWVLAAASLDRFKWWVVDRDTQAEESLFARISTWRQRYLVEGETPEITDARACQQYLAERFPGGDSPREATLEEERMVTLAKDSARVAAQLVKDARTLRNQLARACGNAAYLQLPDGSRWKPRRPKVVSCDRPDVDPLDFGCL
jgi:putative phage-type endonuclease